MNNNILEEELKFRADLLKIPLCIFTPSSSIFREGILRFFYGLLCFGLKLMLDVCDDL